MTNLKDVPKKNGFVGVFADASVESQQKYLALFAKEFVSRFALNHVQSFEDEITPGSDGIFGYARSVIGLDLMACNFSDVTREGDGDRSIKCWKFFMLHFISRLMVVLNMQLRPSTYLPR